MAYIYERATDLSKIPGAILEVQYGFVQHRGLRGRRNPFTGEQPILHSSKGGGVGSTTESEFAQGRVIRCLGIPPTPEVGEVRLRRMESIWGLPWTLRFSNCQHTTNWAALGVARSEQLEALVGVGILALVLYWISTN